MKWESKVSYQMLPYLSLFKNPSSWMALLPLFLLLAGVGFGFFSMLYASLLVALSTVPFAVSNHKAMSFEKSMQENVIISEEGISDPKEDIAPSPLPKNQNVTEPNSDQEEVKDGVVNDTTRSPDLLSESELRDQISTSEESEVECWPFRENVENQNPACESSDGSISDEESLIEIAITTGHHMGHQKEKPKFINCSLQHQEFPSEESLVTEQTLMEFLAEFSDMAEEENLIEIDVSVGSIKYSSRFEIEA